MIKWFSFLVMFSSTLAVFGQSNGLSDDTLINRMKLNTLNLSFESGRASAEDYYNRGILNAFLGDTLTALSDYSIAIKQKPDFDLPYLNRGVIYQKQRKFELAENDFNAAIRLDEFPSIAHNNRGFMYQEWGKIEFAITDFEKAIRIDPSYSQPYMNLVDVYLRQSKNDKAFAVLDRMVAARSKDPKAYATRSDVYRDAGMMRKALDNMDKAVEISGNDPDYLIERSKFKDDYIFDDFGAVEDCDLAIQQNPKNANYYYQRSRPLYDLAEYGAVIENCEKAIALDPRHSNAMIMKANVMDMYNMYEDAKKLYDQAILIDPDAYDGYKQLSILEFSRGNKQKALSILESYIARGNFHKDITEQHGKIAADLKQFEVSINDFTELVDRYPKDPAYYFLRGVARDSIGDHEAACNDMVKADKMGLNEAHQYLRKHCKSKLSAKLLQIEDLLDAAIILESQGKHQEVVVAYTNLLKIAPDSSAFYYNRGKAKRRLEDHQGAIDDYLKAIEMDGDRVVYVVSLAVSYSFLDRESDAIKAYEKAIKIEPRYAMSYYNLGGIYEHQKKYDKAIELFETSLYYSPKYTRAMMALGDCYMEMKEMDNACEWFMRAEKAGDAKAFGKRVRSCN